jgi:hypothetical protein
MLERWMRQRVLHAKIPHRRVAVQGVKRGEPFVDPLVNPFVGEEVFNREEHGALFATPIGA